MSNREQARQDSNIERLLKALYHQKGDRVPNFEIVLEKGFVSFMQGRETQENLWTVSPREALELVRAVGQDAVPCTLSWQAGNGNIQSEQDLASIRFPDLRQAREKLRSYLEAVQGTRVGVCARFSGILTPAYMSTGPTPIESFMYMLYDQPELVERLLDIQTEYDLRLIEGIQKLPFHMYYIGDDISSTTGPLISPRFIAELWAPRMAQIVKAARDTGRPVLFHCCGQLDVILPYLAEWGVNAVHPIQPGANDIYEIHKKYGNQLTLTGNMDVAGVLSYGSPDDVRADTREHIERLSGDGGYIVCSSHSIIDSVPPENYLAMVEATRQFGRF